MRGVLVVAQIDLTGTVEVLKSKIDWLKSTIGTIPVHEVRGKYRMSKIVYVGRRLQHSCLFIATCDLAVRYVIIVRKLAPLVVVWLPNGEL